MTTKLAFAGATALLLALAQSGCANCLKGGRCASPSCESPILPQPQSKRYSHKYKPHYAHKTLCPSPCNIKTLFYGFHTTCWSAWPAGWQNCELPCGSGGQPLPPGELDYAEPVEPLTSGEDGYDPMDDQGDGEPSPSDTDDTDDFDDAALPPPTTGDAEVMPADDLPADDLPPEAPADPEPPLPNEPTSAPAIESEPFDLPREQTDPAPEIETPPTSSRPRPLRAVQLPTANAPQTAVSRPTVTIQVLEEESMPPPLEEVVIEEPAFSGPKTAAAIAKLKFGDTIDPPAVEPTKEISEDDIQPSEFAAPALRIGDRPNGSAAVSRPTITIVEVSAEANVKPEARPGATSDNTFQAGAISVPAPKGNKTGAKSSIGTKPSAPVRHRLSDDADEVVRPVNWIDSYLKTSGR